VSHVTTGLWAASAMSCQSCRVCVLVGLDVCWRSRDCASSSVNLVPTISPSTSTRTTDVFQVSHSHVHAARVCVQFRFSLQFILLKTTQQSQTVTIHTELDSQAAKHRQLIKSRHTGWVKKVSCSTVIDISKATIGWLGSRVVSVLDSGAEGPGFKSQPRRCRVTVLGKLFTPIVPLFTKHAAKLVAVLLSVARVTAGLAESNGSPPPGLLFTSPAG